MECEICKNTNFKQVFTCDCGKVFCSKECINQHLKDKICLIPLKNAVCNMCGESKKLYMCSVCEKVVCYNCIDEHKELHLKDKKYKCEDFKSYANKKIVKEL